MKTIVIYKSKTGFTKKYAEWIAEYLSADIFDVSKVTINMLIPYDTIVYGGSLYAVGISGIKLITKNFDKFKDKKLIIFATGASPARKKVIKEVVNRNFSPNQQNHIKFFYFRGGFNYSKLSFFDKFLMNLLKWKINNKKKEELTSDEIGMLSIYNHPTDFTKKDNIKALIDYITS